MPYLGETPAVGSRSKVNATTTVGTGAERDGYQDRAARDAAR